MTDPDLTEDANLSNASNVWVITQKIVEFSTFPAHIEASEDDRAERVPPAIARWSTR
jgi:hypothetical protein